MTNHNMTNTDAERETAPERVGTIFGLNDAEVRSLLDRVSDAAVSSGDNAPVSIETRFARAAWSGIAEPGDGVAGLLVRTIGPARALSAVLNRTAVAKVAESVRAADSGLDESLESQLADGFRRWRPRLRSDEVMASLSRAAEIGAALMVPGDPGWPDGVDDLGDHAPLALWRRGSIESCLALEQSVAIVGARASTGYGDHMAVELSAGVVERGFAVASGAAYGIDGMAHKAALARDGVTAAFLAGGVDRFYPSGNSDLLRKITERGVVFAELPCGSEPTRWRFLQRNRLIAAASQATVVIEAGRRSGSLNTAGHAAEMGRPLGAVPGPVTSPASAGCHRLIREYAASCVTNADDVAELIGFVSAEGEGVAESSQLSPEHTRVLDALAARTGRSVIEIAARSGLSPGSVAAALGTLGVTGFVAEDENGWVAVRKR